MLSQCCTAVIGVSGDDALRLQSSGALNGLGVPSRLETAPAEQALTTLLPGPLAKQGAAPAARGISFL